MRTILTCIVAILFMFSPPFLFGESNHDLIRLCNDVGDYAECSSQSPLVVLPWTVSQRDTTRKERRPPPPPEKKTTTTRVPKPQDDRSEQQEEKKEDSFWAGCASTFCGGMLNSIISSIFSGGKKEADTMGAGAEGLIVPADRPIFNDSAEVLPALPLPTRTIDTTSTPLIDTSSTLQIDTSPTLPIDSLSTPRIDTSGGRGVQSVISIPDRQETRTTAESESSPIVPEPVGSILNAPSPDLPELYAAVLLGGGFPMGITEDEYDSVGFLIGGGLGVLFSGRLDIELQALHGSFSGNPKFDYVTTTEYPNGNVQEIQNAPIEMSLTTTAYGLRAQYLFPLAPIAGIGVRASSRIMKFREEATIVRDEYMNGSLVGHTTKKVDQEFSKVALGFDASFYFVSGVVRWELLAGYEGANYYGSKQAPLSLDWSGYRGQFFFGDEVKLRVLQFH